MASSSWSLFIFLIFLSIITHGQTTLFQNLKNKVKQVIARNSSATNRRYDYEEMMLFPNIGFQRKDGNWRLNIHGWRFQTSNRNKFLGESSSRVAERIARLLATSEQIVYYNDTFQRDRLKPFMVRDKKNEEIFIMIGEKHNYTTKTDTEGQCRTSFIIPDGDVQKLKETSNHNDEIVKYKAVGDNGDLWEGKVYLLERRGLSVISDIDDTIKVSEVLDKIRLVANTFIHGFRVVEGMPEVYRGWKDKYNCSFHYLSAMPDQLYTVTKEFVDDHNFPDGTFHMRHFRWSSASIYNFVHSVVLIGDSGEHDPEIYGLVARKYPKRVYKIFIRAVKGETSNDNRFLTAFKDIPRDKWFVFTDPINQLPKDLNITEAITMLSTAKNTK